MKLLAEWRIQHRSQERRIELYQGDLAALPPEHAVDILVVSAFQDDYMPMESTVIGALYQKGISVAELARNKQNDLRKEFSCWLSQPVIGAIGFKRILCIESDWKGSPPEITDDIFRVLAPCSISEFPNGSVAMPVVGTGNQGYPVDQMMKSILHAAVFWFRHGLNLRVLKIVVHSESSAEIAKKVFTESRQADESHHARSATPHLAPAPAAKPTAQYDVFLSYSHEDTPIAESVLKLIQLQAPGARVFFDRTALGPGSSWILEIAGSLDSSRWVVPLYTPNYWTSKYCQLEFSSAFLRQTDTGRSILFPLYYRKAEVPSMFMTVQFVECREADGSKLADACRQLCRVLA
jgi:hypothetical protein